MTDFRVPTYETSKATDFVLDALNAGFRPFHFKSRETLYRGPAVLVDEYDPEGVAEELGTDEVLLEQHSPGKYAAHPRQSARPKHD